MSERGPATVVNDQDHCDREGSDDGGVGGERRLRGSGGEAASEGSGGPMRFFNNAGTYGSWSLSRYSVRRSESPGGSGGS